MKKIFNIFLLILSLNAKSQTWDSIKGSLAGGFIIKMEAYHGKLYASVGYDKKELSNFHMLNYSIMEWNGNGWSNMGLNANRVQPTFGVYNDTLYVSGDFTSLWKSQINIEKLVGSKWSEFGKAIPQSWDIRGDMGAIDSFASNSINAIREYHGKLYVSGTFGHNVVAWDGNNWLDVGGGICENCRHSPISTALTVYNGELYTTGWFGDAGGKAAGNIAKWNDTSWASLSEYSPFAYAPFQMIVYDGCLYVAPMTPNTSTYDLFKWDGKQWSTFPVKANKGITVMAVYNGDLYIAGNFDTINNMRVNHIARWDGKKWHSLGSGVANGHKYQFMNSYSETDYAFINALVVSDGALYIGGNFTEAGGMHVDNIARWKMPVKN